MFGFVGGIEQLLAESRWHERVGQAMDHQQRHVDVDDLVDAYGVPLPGSAFEGHDLVVYQPYLQGNKDMTQVSEPLGRGRIVSSLSLLVRRFIAAGIGLGEIPVYRGERDGLVRLWPERTRLVPYDLLLVTHADLRHTARVRVVIDEIVAVFSGTGE